MRKFFLAAVVITNLIALPALLFFNHKLSVSRATRNESTLPVFGLLGEFKMTDATNTLFTNHEMAGRVWVANFMFTRCPSQCPAMNLKMKMLRGFLDPKVGLLSFSVDPVHDTPERLRDYSILYGAIPGSWNFLTGDPRELKKVLSYCHFGFSDDPNLHGMKLVLIDRNGAIRAYYDYDDNRLSHKIRTDIKSLDTRGAA